ncbi:hypothetical protein C0Q70_00109 [Pomacea canaliculata]|uniref:Reverse transcriptase domain-containing protein n=1 Tax=Pomacea canaliculata TaxID=400727 RepID=A0A2T7PVR2_POMCA|nr:hypothetical protein C0Q70_00109 [Pomacea canaliculata]
MVPTLWLNLANKTCYWPKHSRAVIECVKPEESWSIFPFVGIKKESDNYRKAAEKIKQLKNEVSDAASTYPKNEKCLQWRRRLAPKSTFSLGDDGEMCYINQLNEEASGVLDIPGTQKSSWSSEEIRTLQEYFADELHEKRTQSKTIKRCLCTSCGDAPWPSNETMMASAPDTTPALGDHAGNEQELKCVQSAYRPKHSCETALLRLMNDLLCSADAGKVTLVVLLDLSAAFDVIDHTTLLTRLQMEIGG